MANQSLALAGLSRSEIVSRYGAMKNRAMSAAKEGKSLTKEAMRIGTIAGSCALTAGAVEHFSDEDGEPPGLAGVPADLLGAITGLAIGIGTRNKLAQHAGEGSFYAYCARMGQQLGADLAEESVEE